MASPVFTGEARCLFMPQLVLGTVRLDNVGIVKLAAQVSANRGNVFFVQRIALAQLLFCQTFCFCLVGKLVDAANGIFNHGNSP